MFLRDDAADRQLQRLTANKNQHQDSIHSWSSGATTASTAFKSKEDGKALTGSNNNGGDALLESLIRDLSFWDSIPPSSSTTATKWIFSFPSPLPQRPLTKTHSTGSHSYYQHRQPQHQSLQRRRSSIETASSRDHRHYYSNNNRSRRVRDEKYDRQNSSGSRERTTRSRGSITYDNRNEQIWQPLPSPQWKSTVDPTTGRTYWYDSVTRRTQWEKVRFNIPVEV